MKKYGFFGGSFNPPTYAHLEIAKNALDEIGLDKVFFVPVGNSYDKTDLQDERHRYNMLKLMCIGEKNIEVEDIELGTKEKMQAIDAIKKINNKYIDSKNYFIMGADNFAKLPSWNEAESLLNNYNLIVFTRGEYEVKIDKENIKILKIEKYKEYRSGVLRELEKQKKYDEMEKYTKKEVVDYIKCNWEKI